MKRFFPGDAKTVIVETTDDLSFEVYDHPLSRTVVVRRAPCWLARWLVDRWERLMAWTPTDEQMDTIVAGLEGAGRLADIALKACVLVGVLYVTLSVLVGLGVM